MFTGIVEAIGRLVHREPLAGDLRLRIHTGALDLSDVALGDSIATNGVCLTVTRLEDDGFWADVSNETAAHSTLGALPVGALLNLEKAMLVNGRLGGHLVSGHVDGVGEVIGRSRDARSLRLVIRAPQELARYIASKGSICVDGVSLTVNAVRGAEFDLNIVPHTADCTTLACYRPGHHLNLEVDVIARYLERLLNGDEHASSTAPTVDRGLLERAGFLSGTR